jgi:hypothetical protein
MKALFLILLLANLGFYAYSEGYFASGQEAADEAQRSPLNAEKIHILTAAQVAALPKLKPLPKTAACMEWGSFSAADAARAGQALLVLALGDRLTERSVDEPAVWWVFLPPQGSKAAGDKKLEELKRLGVDDFFLIQDEGKWRYAISLGVFSTQDGAKKHLEALRAMGVKTAQAAERQPASRKVVIQIRDGGEAAVARVNEIKTGFPGAEVKACTIS